MGRYLGPVGFGQYTIVVAFLQFFAIFGDMGLTLITAQIISQPQANEQKLLSNIFTLRIISSLLFFLAAPIVSWFFPYPFKIKIAIAIFSLAFFFTSLTQVLTGLFQKKLQIIKVTLSDLINKIILVFSVLIVSAFNLGLLGIIIGGVLSNSVSFLWLFYSTRKIVKIKLSFDLNIWKKIIKKAWPIAVSIVFNLIYLKTDTLILSLFHSETAVGIYGATFRFLEILIMLPTMFMGLLLPLFTRYWAEKNIEKFKKTMQTALEVLLIAAVPLVIGTLFLAEPIITLIVGKNFIAAAPVLKIIVLASAIVFIGTFYGHIIVALNKQREMIWAYASTAFISLIFYFIFIPKYSYFGAAWSTVLAETLIAIICFWMVTKTTKIKPNFHIMPKILLSSAVMAIFLYFFKNYNLFLTLILSITIYFFSLYRLKGLPRKLIKEISNF